MTRWLGRDFEQLINERDFTFDAWLFVMDVTSFDGSDGFDPG